jgi:SAM-dependent methyltransferase
MNMREKVPESTKPASSPLPLGRDGIELPDNGCLESGDANLDHTPDVKSYYDGKYKEPNYFRQSPWLFTPYISSLVSFVGLKRGSLVLDVGCGQGFLSHLFHERGMKVHGIDISETGVRIAQDRYGALGIKFEAADISTAVFPFKFDCIFVRSCSLHNTKEFAASNEVTARLMNHLKPEGVLIFAYNTNFSSSSSPSFRCHSLRDVTDHFRDCSDSRIFFSTKADTIVLGKYAFTALMTRINILLSKACGIGGDIVCVLKNPSRS